MPDMHEVTGLLARWANGDQQALNDLTPIVYKELRRLAASYLRRESQNPTLQPTALVHEAYLRLSRSKGPRFENRSHFFGVAARLMRQILVDHARRRRAGKRAGINVFLDGRRVLAVSAAETWWLLTTVWLHSKSSIPGRARKSNCAISQGCPWTRSLKQCRYPWSQCAAI